MKVFDSFFHGETSPLLESFRTQKEINVLLVKDTLSHLRSDRLRRQQYFPAYVLHLVHRKVHERCDSLVRDVLAVAAAWLGAPESEK